MIKKLLVLIGFFVLNVPGSGLGNWYGSLDYSDNVTYYAQNEASTIPAIIQLLLNDHRAVTPSSITVSGPATVDESGGAQYTCTANYSDGSTADVTDSADWSEDAAEASISSSGYLTTEAVDADVSFAVTASYGGQSDTLAVTIRDVPVTVTGIMWDGEFEEFRFAVQDNGGFFQYAPTQYIRPFSYDTEECRSSPSQSQLDSYDCIANGNLAEFTTPLGDIWLNAMAKGTGSVASPPNGLKVQGYLETIPVGLTMDHALDTEQNVISWVSRRFSAEQEAGYDLTAILSGTVEFDNYYSNSLDNAFYIIEGEVTLEEIINDTVFSMMSGFPLSLDDLNPTFLRRVRLRPQTEAGDAITYRLKITLRLESHIVNYDPSQYVVSRAVEGTFRLGSESSPFTLEATIANTETN